MSIERIVPGTNEWDLFYANHICRYAFAKEQIEKCEATNILDAACGVGYGSFFLAADEKLTLTAIDRSEEALDIANKNFSHKNTRFIVDDCHTLMAASAYGKYDAVVSFETLEHLPHPEKFVKSCFLNLKQGGKLIISTPNQFVSSPGGLNWYFHEKEYTPVELIKFLSDAGFSQINIYGQQMTAIGKLREQVRSELNRINSNPYMRLGRMIQRIIKDHKFPAVLPEQRDDFEMKLYRNPQEIMALGLGGPFVLIATCTKP